MFDRVLSRIRARVRARSYVMTVHADDEMDADGLSIFDVENAILTGRVTERQTERGLREHRYVIRGAPLEGDDSVVVVAKIGTTGKVVILTVYVE